METITLENGVAMPLEGFGVFQVQEETCEETVAKAIAMMADAKVL